MLPFPRTFGSCLRAGPPDLRTLPTAPQAQSAGDAAEALGWGAKAAFVVGQLFFLVFLILWLCSSSF